MSDIAPMFAGMAVATLVMALGGYALARSINRNVAVLLAGVLAAGMLLFGKYLSDSVWVASIVPAWMLPIWGNWLPLLAGMLAGVCWVLSDRSRLMKAMVLGALALLSLTIPYRAVFAERPAAQRGEWMAGVLHQTTDATCAPAAAATALRIVGVQSTEAQMVDLSLTTWNGTTLHGVMRGLAVKLATEPWRPVAMRLTTADLRNLKGPAILFVGLSEDVPPEERFLRWGWRPGVAHTVVLMGARSDGRFDIGDPSTGREIWTDDALRVLWHGVGIVLEPR